MRDRPIRRAEAPAAGLTRARVVSRAVAAATVAVVGAWLAISFASAQVTSPIVLVLVVQGAIGPATTEYVTAGLADARERGAALVVLRMDTPGGLDSATRDIIRAILASPVPVATYVHPSGARAASAGTYILYASHLAAMTPGTNLGAATPVQIGGGGGLPFSPGGRDEDGKTAPKVADPMTSKIVNDAAAFIRGLADLHGRNADWAEKAVRQAASLSAREALDANVIEIVAGNVDELLRQADGRTVRLDGRTLTLHTAAARVDILEPDWRSRLLAVITNPNIAYLLMIVGIYGILFEFLSPGTIFSGVIGAIALAVALFALNLLPINYAGIGLIMLGVGLMTAEAFVPSFGILGIGGIVAFALGSLFLFDTDIPHFTLSLPVIATATAVSAAFLVIAAAAAIRAHRRSVATGEPALVGSRGTVVEWREGRGQIHVHGERWLAHSRTALRVGQVVHVVARDGLVLLVEPELETDGSST